MCRKLTFLVLTASLLGLVSSASAAILQCDAGTGTLQSGWTQVQAGLNVNVGGTGINVTLATGQPSAIEPRAKGGSGPLADVETDFYFADNENYSPGSDFILTLGNLTAGTAYKLLSYHSRTDEGDTTIPNVTITGATNVTVPDSIVQNHAIMETPAECLFTAGAGDVVIRYQGPDGGCLGCQAFFNGFILSYPEVQSHDPNPVDEAEQVCAGARLSWAPGFHAASHDVYLGSDFNDVNDANSTNHPNVDYNNVDANFYDPCRLDYYTTYYWRVDAVNDSNVWRGEVWRFTVEQGRAYNPSPSDGVCRVSPSKVLTWTPMCFAGSHDVYLGTNRDDVNDANSSSHPDVDYNSVDVNSFDPCGLEAGVTYYWRIDEVNNSTIWKGKVWSFRVEDFFVVVDDMEGYESIEHLWNGWIDGGAGGNGTGSLIWLLTDPPPIRDEKSMGYWYDNTFDYYGAGYYSEIESRWPLDPCDWTAFGTKVLTLWFYGDPYNDATETEQTYVGLEDKDSSYAEVRYPLQDMNDIKVAEWQEWNIALNSFTDVNLADVEKLFIGFGIRGSMIPGGYGMVCFDDIRRYVPICVCPVPYADLSGDCVVDYEDLRIMARKWLETGYFMADLYKDGKVDFKDYAILAGSWLDSTLWPLEE